MAISQLDDSNETIEGALARANAAALKAKRDADLEANIDLSDKTEGEIRAIGKKLSYEALIKMVGASNTPHAVRLGCCKELIDRDEGKAKERIETHVTGGLHQFNVDIGADMILAGIEEWRAKKKRVDTISSNSGVSQKMIEDK